jgi:hypothetical protein
MRGAAEAAPRIVLQKGPPARAAPRWIGGLTFFFSLVPA